MNTTIPLLAILAFGLAARSIPAATTRASISVSVTVPSTCLASSPPATLGMYLAQARDVRTGVSVNCTQPIPYTVGLAPSHPGAQVRSLGMAATHGAVLQGYTSGSSSRLHPALGRSSVPNQDSAQESMRYLPGVPFPDSMMIVITY
jgi:hypothetical protein